MSITVVKKRHTIKNTVMSTLDKVILFVGKTFVGHTHDYTMLKEEFPPEKAWFEFVQVLVDLGYQGILTDYDGDDIQIPHKKPIDSGITRSPLMTMLLALLLDSGISIFIIKEQL